MNVRNFGVCGKKGERGPALFPDGSMTGQNRRHSTGSKKRHHLSRQFSAGLFQGSNRSAIIPCETRKDTLKLSFCTLKDNDFDYT